MRACFGLGARFFCTYSVVSHRVVLSFNLCTISWRLHAPASICAHCPAFHEEAPRQLPYRTRKTLSPKAFWLVLDLVIEWSHSLPPSRTRKLPLGGATVEQLWSPTSIPPYSDIDSKAKVCYLPSFGKVRSSLSYRYVCAHGL